MAMQNDGHLTICPDTIKHIYCARAEMTHLPH